MKNILLLVLIVLVGNVWGQTALYTVASTSTVTTTGTPPSGSSATYAQTFGTVSQMTSGNSATFTLIGYAGYRITSVTLSMRSNTSAGRGSLSVVAGSTNILSIADATFANATWNGAYTTTYTNITRTPTAYSIGTGENVVFTIAATTNSLYIQSYSITYTPAITGYFWNGGSIASNPAAGGNGIWSTTNSWRQPSATGAQATWADANPAILAGTAGTVALSGSVSPTSTTFNTSGYSLTTSGASAITLSNGVVLGTNALTLAPISTASLSLSGTISGTGTASSTILTHSGPGTTSLATGNTFTGKTLISGGFISTSGESAFGANPGAFTADQLTFNGGGVFASGNINFSSNRGLTLGAGGGIFNSNGNVITLTNVVTGSGAITKIGTGRLELAGNNTFTGGVNINAGTVQLDIASGLNTTTPNAITFGASSTGILQINGFDATISGLNSNATVGSPIVENDGGGNRILTINTSSANVFGGVMQNGTAGTFGFTKLGSGSLSLSGNNTHSGVSTLSAGTLNINSTTALGTGTFIIAGGIIDNTSAAAITNSNNNVQNWNGNFTYTGTQNLNLGTGNAVMNAARTVTTTAGNLTIGGIVSGAFSLTKAGAGTLTLSNLSNTYSANTTVAGTTINTGFIATSGEAAFGANPASFNASYVTLNGGGIQTTGTSSIAFASSNRGITIGALGGTFDTPSSLSSITLTNVATGAGLLTKSGLGTLVMNGAHTLTGGTTITNGTMTVNNGSSMGTGALTMSQSAGSNTALNLNNTAQTISSLQSNFADVTGTRNQIITLGTGHSLTINQSSNTTYGTGAVSTLTSIIAGTGNLIKSGSGSLTLTGANTYTGTTSINSGTLFVNGSTASGSAVSVSGGAILAGSGIAGGTVSLTGVISPGATLNSIATLTTGALTFNNGANFKFETNNVLGTAGTNWDLISAASINFAASSNITIDLTGAPIGFNQTTSNTWTIAMVSGAITNFTNATFTVSLANFTPSTVTGTFSVQVSGNNLNLVYTAPTNTIFTTNAAFGPFCNTGSNAATINFTYTPTAAFTSGTAVFTAVLSNNLGSFASGTTNIGTVTSNASGTQSISATIPALQAAGTLYRIRVVSITPTATGTDNGNNITINDPPTTSNAGATQTLCNATSATLAGNNPTVGTGNWTLVSGSGTITSPGTNNSGITGLGLVGNGSDNVFKWTITNGACSSNSDVIIHVDAPATVSNPGTTQILCNAATTATLAGNSPTVGTGNWSLFGGTGTITTPSANNSGLTGLAVGNNVFRWTITNGACSSNNNVTITVNPVNTFSPATPALCVNGSTAITTGLSGTFSSILPAGVTIPGTNLTSWTINGNGATAGVGSATFTTTSGACTNTLNFTLNDVPGVTIANGAGTFCTNTTITASGGIGGTIYYQGTTSNGTSTASPSSSELISSSGTYYFRARNANGCWGTQGSVNVTINTAINIGTNPTNASVTSPNTANFSVSSITGTVSSYQWQVSTDAGSSWNNVITGTGGTTASYTTAATNAGMNGYQYRCVLNGPCSNVTSTVATLSIIWEDFETGSKGGYAAANVTCTAGSWNMSDALIGTTANDRKNGSQSVRVQNSGIVSMNFDLTSGVGNVNILHAIYGGDGNSTWRLEASTNGGTNWTAFVSSTVTTSSTTLTNQSFTLNLPGNVRFRIVKLSGGGNRISFDDISITSFAGCTPPTNPATSFTSSSITVNTATAGWTRGNGNNVLVVVRAGGAVNADPVSGTSYTANAAFGSGSQIGTGNYVVYNGSGTSVNLTALNAGITYHFAVYEYFTTGTCYNLTELTGNFTTTAPTITLSSPNPAVAAASIIQGTTNNAIYRFDIAAVGNATLSGVTINTSGTYAAGNISNFKCWYSADASFNAGTDVLLSTKTASLGVGAHIFPSFTSQVISNATTGYFFITTDLPCLSTVGNTVIVNAITTADITFLSGTKTGTASAGGVQTIAISTPNNVTAQSTSNCINGGTTVNWTLPTGCYDATTGIFVFAKAGSFTAATPTGNGVSYTANPIFGNGTSFDGGFCVYKGAGSTVSVTGLTNGTNYTYKIFTRNGTSWTSGVITNCTPLISICTAASTDIFNEFIQGVIFNTISNTSLATTYTDFTSTPTTVEKGVTYPLTIYNGDYFSTDVVKVWADWNGNGDFTDAGENIITTTSGDPAPYFLNVSIPVTAITGSVRMRIRLYDSAVGVQNTTPCGTHEYGEVEDYLLNVVVPCIPTHSITSFSPINGPVGTHVTINGTGFSATSTVNFNEIASTSVQFIDATKLIATIPSGSTTGIVKVIESGCYANSASNFTLTSASGSCVSSASFSNLIISEVYDSQNNNVAYVELYNPTSSPINLATGNYTLKIDNNTAASPVSVDRTINLSGIVPAGGVFLINFGTSSNTCNKTWNFTAGGGGINASDNIFLAANGVDIDRVNGPSNDGYTISRNGNAVGPTPTFNPADWTTSGIENCTNLGIAPVVTYPNPILNISNLVACNINLSVALTEGNLTPPNDVTYKWFYNDGIASGWTEITSSVPAGYTISGQTSNNLQISNNTNFVTALDGYQFYSEGSEATTCKNVSAASKFTFNTRPIYRSTAIATGNWTTISNWEMAISTAGPWVTACTYPTSINSTEVIIQTGSNVTLDIDNTLDKLTIEAAATLQLALNSQLTIYDNNIGADFILNGTLIYRSNTSNTLIFDDPAGVPRATWTMGSAATLIKTNTAGVADFRDYYEGGIINIPATANWIYRYDGTGDVAVVSASSGAPMFYPNLTFESTSGSHDFIAFTEIFTGRLDVITVKGDFTIGGNGNNVRVFNNNFNATPFQILGDLYIAAGSTLTNDGYAAVNGNYDVQWREGAGFELKGDALIEGTLDVTHVAPGTASSVGRVVPGEEGLILSKTSGAQDIIGDISESFITNKVIINSTTSVALSDINLNVYNKLIMTQGNINVGTNLITLGTSATNVGTLNYTSGAIFGNFRRWFAAATNLGASSGLFPMGSGIYQKFVTVEYTTAPASGGYLTATYNTNNMALFGVPATNYLIPAEGSCGSPFLVSTLSDDGYWEMSDNGTLSTGNYDITFDAEGFTTINNLCQLTALKRVGVGNWLQSGNHKATIGTLLRPIVKREGANGWSNWGFGGGPNNPLPIELLSFNADLNATNYVDLTWSTASEINNDFFIIEKSKDAVNFEEVLHQKGAGNSNVTLNYRDVDKNPFNGVSYYRLKQTDFNGNHTYSEIVPISMKSKNALNVNWVNYNAETGIISGTVNSQNKKLDFKLYDLSGRLILTTTQIIEGNSFKFQLDNNIPKSIYLLHVNNGIEMKIVKVN